MMQKIKTPLIIAGIIVLAYLIFKAFFGGGGASSEIITSNSTSTAVGQSFVDQLSQLKKISLSPAVFSDPVFQSLQDFSQPLPDLPVGRDNPFAPVSGLDTSNIQSDNSSALQFTSATTTTKAAASSSTSTRR